MEVDQVGNRSRGHGAHHRGGAGNVVGQPQAVARSAEVTAWIEVCRKLAEWLDEALEVLSPIATGALILGLLSALWLALTK